MVYTFSIFVLHVTPFWNAEPTEVSFLLLNMSMMSYFCAFNTKKHL